MELRHLENIVVEKAIVHVIDKSLPEPLYSQQLIITEEILEEFIPQHLTRMVANFENQKARFDETESSPMRDLATMITSGNEYFIGDTCEVAKAMYKAVGVVEGEDAFDLLIALVKAGDESALAIMKLDYQQSYQHDVVYGTEGVSVEIVAQNVGIPTGKQRLSNCALILEPGKYDYDMMLMSRTGKNSEGQLVQYFTNFLGSETYLDNTAKTIALHKTVESWLRKSIKDDAPRAEECRQHMMTLMTEHAIADVSDLIYKLTDDNNQKESLEEKLSMVGIVPGEKFDIDKKWVEKKLRHKQVKTDTGFVIKGEKEFFSDKTRFESIINTDGSMTYIIKNVRNIAAK